MLLNGSIRTGYREVVVDRNPISVLYDRDTAITHLKSEIALTLAVLVSTMKFLLAITIISSHLAVQDTIIIIT